MKTSLTTLICLAIFIMVSNPVVSQSINRLQVTAPESIAGEYEVVSGAFGMNEIDELSGELKLIEDTEDPTSDGCTEAIESLEGTIALVDRGACAFVDKALSAQNAGAIAMIVCNNVEGDDPFVMGGDAPDITIPCVMVSYEDCQTIRAELDNAVQVTIDYYDAPCVAECAAVNFPENTVWGHNGEGAFACGLGDWTVVAISESTSVWKWDADTYPVGQSGAPRSVDSATECNGAAQMDFCDYNFNPGPASTSKFFASDLITPVIDLTGVESAVMHFDQYLLPLSKGQEIAFYTQSLDGGQTWGDTINIPSPYFIPSNGTAMIDGSQKLKFPIRGNTAECLIKFIANGNFYYWTIDDFYITEEPISRFSIDKSSFSGAPNFKTPASQLDKVPFMITVLNEGNVDMIDVSYTATVTKDGIELYSTTQQLGDLPKFSTRENVIAPDFWEMNPELGEYQITYTLDAANISDDTDLEDNIVSSAFVLTETTFSKLRSEEEVDQAYMVGLGQDANFISFANGYYIYNGQDIAPRRLSTGFATDIYSKFGFTIVTAEVRQWVLDSNGDGIVNLATETTLLAQGQILLDPSNPIDLRNVEIDLHGGSSFTNHFISSSHYLAIIHVAPLSPPSESTYLAPLSSGFVNGEYGNKDYSFAPTDFAFSELTGGLGRPASFSDFTGTEGTPNDQGSRNLSPESSLSWQITMEIDYAPYIPIMSNTVDINNEINVSLYPNPATNKFTLDLKQMEVSSAINVEIVDIKGTVISNDHFSHVKEEAIQINTTHLKSGIYLVNVYTDYGVKTKRLFVKK